MSENGPRLRLSKKQVNVKMSDEIQFLPTAERQDCDQHVQQAWRSVRSKAEDKRQSSKAGPGSRGVSRSASHDFNQHEGTAGQNGVLWDWFSERASAKWLVFFRRMGTRDYLCVLLVWSERVLEFLLHGSAGEGRKVLLNGVEWDVLLPWCGEASFD